MVKDGIGRQVKKGLGLDLNLKRITATDLEVPSFLLPSDICPPGATLPASSYTS